MIKPLVVVRLAIVLLILSPGVVFLAWMSMPARRAVSPEMLALEREEDREEARAAFSQPLPPTPEQKADFGPILVKLSKAINESDAEKIKACWNGERFVSECVRKGFMDSRRLRLSSEESRRLANGFSSVFASAFTELSQFLVWQKIEIRRVRLSADGQEAIVIATHFSDDYSQPFRWWLTKKTGQWQIYDFEDLKTGLRCSIIAAATASPEHNTNPTQTRDWQAGMLDAIKAISNEDFEAANKAIVPLRQINSLPSPFLAVRALLEANIALNLGEPGKANGFLDEAERNNPDMPIVHELRAAANQQLGNHAAVIDDCNKYDELLGPDANVLCYRGISQASLNRREDAITSFQLGLELEPQNYSCLSALRWALPAPRKKEWVERFNKLHFEDIRKLVEFASEANEDSDLESLEAIAREILKRDPDNEDGIFHTSRLALDRKQTDKAMALIKKAFALKPDDKKGLLKRLVDLLVEADLGEETYTAAPAEHRSLVFRSLADACLGTRFEPGFVLSKMQRERLARLVELHRKSQPNDHWIFFYEGEMLLPVEKYAEAEGLYAKTLTAIPADDSQEYRKARNRLLMVMRRLKLGHEAYLKHGPSVDVFDFLAGEFASSDDSTGLKKLIEMHAAKFPDDSSILYWTGIFDSRSNDHKKAIESFRAYAKMIKNLPKASKGRMLMINKEIIRSLIRLGDFGGARDELESIKEHRDPLLEILIAAASGDVNATLEAIRRLLDVERFDLDFLYGDDEVAKLLRTEKMKPVRDKYPDPRGRIEPPPMPVKPQK